VRSMVLLPLCMLPLGTGASSVLAQSATYSQTFSLGPLRLTQQQLGTVVSRAHSLIDAANPDSLARYATEGLTVTDGPASITLSGDYSSQALANAPTAAYDIQFSYTGPSQSPVSHVSISLQDYSREVVVRGTSRDQVAALSAAIRASLEEGTTLFGGTGQRILAGEILVLLPVVFLYYLLVGRKQTNVPVYYLLLLLAVPVVLLPPWQHIFPGTVVLSPDAAFLVRFAPGISFLGLLVGIASLALALRPPRGPTTA